MSLGRKSLPSAALSVHSQSTEINTVYVDSTGAISSKAFVKIETLLQDLPRGESLTLVRLPQGTFTMGSPRLKGEPDEMPAHLVRVPEFYLSQCTITQRQWKAVMRTVPPCRGKGPELPVDRVSFDAAEAFCQTLSKATGRPFRLPTEAEWEYACRAGNQTAFSFGDMISTEVANYVGWHAYEGGPKGEYRHGPIRGGTFFPNAYGLYDMHGNLWEWCEDRWHSDYVGAPLNGQAWSRGGTGERVLRGGSWHDPPNLCRSAARLKLMPTEGEDFVGIRVALSQSE